MFENTCIPLKVSILCGIISSIFYICIDIFGILSRKDYNFTTQSISDLVAVESPIRQNMAILLLIYNILVIVFGLGVLVYDPENRNLQIIGCLILANAILTIGGIVFPKYLNEAVNSQNNVKNTIVMFFSVLCLIIAMILASFSFKNWFSYVSGGILIAFVILTILGVTIIPMLNKGTPFSGIQEHTMAYSFVLWIFLLTIVLL